MASSRFVNRVDELAALEGWWDRGERPALVWGRRRVGKTLLLQHFAQGRRAVFHTGAGRPPSGELTQLARQVAAVDTTGRRDLLARPYVDWDDALEDLAVRAEAFPLLVVLDELPELVRLSPELPGVLRAFLDRAGGTNLRLLLCGSAVRVMQALQEERAPLYGRFDLSLLVHPFRPHEAAEMLPDLSPSDRALVHGLLGGVPLYLSWWDQAQDVAENLRRLACQPGAPLLTEGQLVLATEAEPGETPAAVLHAIAAGRTRYGQIKDALRAEPLRTLERLGELRLVERVVPVTDEGRVTRRASYRIADNFLAFHLGLLSRYRAEIDRGLGDQVLPVLLEDLDDHLGPRWEEAVRQHLRRLAARGDLGEGVLAVGPWWDERSAVEIDAVALAGRARRPVLAAEAKWARRVDGRRVAERLRQAAQQLPGADADDIRLLVAGRETVDDAPDGVAVVTAADVYEAG